MVLLKDLVLPFGAALPSGSRGVVATFVPKQVGAPAANWAFLPGILCHAAHWL